MIDPTHPLPIVRQAQLLDLSRSSVYYLPQPTPDSDLALMRCIDELHLEHPFAGARMLRDLLRLDGWTVGRKHIATLMRTMGIEALYQRPNTSRRHAAHRAVHAKGARRPSGPAQGDAAAQGGGVMSIARQQTQSSCAGLTRASIRFARELDCRIKSGNDAQAQGITP